MKDFRIVSFHEIRDAKCPKCRRSLVTLPDGLLSELYVCVKCKAAYEIGLVKVPTRRLTDVEQMVAIAVKEGRKT